MKFGSLRDGTRDGRLVVIGQDVTLGSDAAHLAPSLLRALEDWDRVGPELDLIARGLDGGGQPVERFHERVAHSPLPHAPRLLVAEAEGGGGSRLRPVDAEAFLDPRAPLPEADGVAISLAVACGPVRAGAGEAEAAEAIRLALLMLRLSRAEVDPKAEPVCFAPAAVTPEALAGVALHPRVVLNGTAFAPGGALAAVPFELGVFARLIARAAESGAVEAGSVFAAPPFLTRRVATGENLRVEMRDAAGHTVFGAIEQTIGTARPREPVTGIASGGSVAAAVLWAPWL